MVCHHTRPSSCSIFPYHHMIWARGPFVVMRCRAISHARARACARPNSVMPPSARSPSIRPPRERALTEEPPRHTHRDASRHHPEGVSLCAVCGTWRARAGPATGRRPRRPPTHPGRPDLGVCCVLCVGRSVGRSVEAGEIKILSRGAGGAHQKSHWQTVLSLLAAEVSVTQCSIVQCNVM